MLGRLCSCPCLLVTPDVNVGMGERLRNGLPELETLVMGDEVEHLRSNSMEEVTAVQGGWASGWIGERLRVDEDETFLGTLQNEHNA